MEHIITVFEGRQVQAFFTKKLEDFETFKKSLPFKVYLPIQKHTDWVHVLEGNFIPQIADAIITNRKSVLIGIKTADCVPILIYCPDQKVIGAVHAGWRGTAKGILRKTIKKMIEIYSCKKENFLIAIGPHIRGCCYEVGEEVIDAMKSQISNNDYIISKNGKFHIDLGMANVIQAIEEGLKKEQIFTVDDCTYCKSNEYASYRFHGKGAGRQYGFIGML
jgi:YfiH family protein